jgi:hypothetical protein
VGDKVGERVGARVEVVDIAVGLAVVITEGPVGMFVGI